jgi:hypothetical protein
MATSALRNVQEEHHADEGDDQALFDERALERFDRAINQVGSVIDRFDGHALRQARCNLRESILYVFSLAARSLDRPRNSLYDRQCSAQNRRRAPRLRAHFDSDHGTGRGGVQAGPAQHQRRLSRLQRWPITAAFAVSAAIGRPRLRGKPKVRPARNSLTGRPSTRA